MAANRHPLFSDFSTANLRQDVSFPRRWAGHTRPFPIVFPSIAEQVSQPEQGLCRFFGRDEELFQTLQRRLDDAVRASAIGTDIPRLVRKFRVFHIRDGLPCSASLSDGAVIPIPGRQQDDDNGSAASSNDDASSRAAAGERLLFNATEDLVFNSTAEVFHDQIGQPNYRHRDVLIQDLLHVLGQQLHCEDARAAVDGFLAFVDFNPDTSIHATTISEDLSRFCADKLGERHPVVQLLKMCNQGMIAPAVTYMTLRNYNYFRYRDHRTSWYIDLSFHHAASGELSGVTVIHRKSEISTHASGEDDRHFEFTWYLLISLDSSLAITAVELRIVDLWFHAAVPAAYQERVTRLLAMSIGLIDPSAVEQQWPAVAATTAADDKQHSSSALIYLSAGVVGVAALCAGVWLHQAARGYATPFL